MSSLIVYKNSLFNLIGRFYLLLIGFLITPLFFRVLDAEAFALLGIYSLLSSWFLLLDSGLSPLVGRDISAANSSSRGIDSFFQCFRSIEVILITVAMLVVGFLSFTNSIVANEWLQIKYLDLHVVEQCIVIMGCVIALRLWGNIYRSGLMGLERHGLVNVVSILVNTIKYPAAFLYVSLIRADIVDYFVIQMLAGLIEFGCLFKYFYSVSGYVFFNFGEQCFFWDKLKLRLGYSVSIFYSSLAWIAITQTDKIVLSHTLSLSDFGEFSLIVLLASSVFLTSGPITQALSPRLTSLIARKDIVSAENIYFTFGQVISAVSFSVAFSLFIFSSDVVELWTGNSRIASKMNDFFTWFVFGNAFMAVGSLQYFLQVAYGDLKLHVKGLTLSLIIQVPSMVFAALYFGVIGVSVCWFVFRCSWFFWWTSIVHSRFLDLTNIQWILGIIRPIFAAFFITVFFYILNPTVFFPSALGKILVIGVSGCVILSISLLSIDDIRKTICIFLKKKLQKALF